MAERYPLAALLELREAVRGGCEEQLAAAIRLEAERSRQLRHAEESEAAARERVRERRAATPSSASAARLAERRRYVERLEGALVDAVARRERAALALAEAREATARARGALSSAEADVELVRRNRERWSDARRAREMRRAEAELEDIVAARHRGKADR